VINAAGTCTELFDVSYTLLNDWCNSVLSRLPAKSTTDTSTLVGMQGLDNVSANLSSLPQKIDITHF